MVLVARGIRPRDADVRAAAEVNAADRLDRERRDVLDVPLHQPLESVPYADDVDALECRANRRGADDAVDARGGAARHENGKLPVMVQRGPPRSIIGRRGEVTCAIR